VIVLNSPIKVIPTSWHAASALNALAAHRSPGGQDRHQMRPPKPRSSEQHRCARTRPERERKSKWGRPRQSKWANPDRRNPLKSLAGAPGFEPGNGGTKIRCSSNGIKGHLDNSCVVRGIEITYLRSLSKWIICQRDLPGASLGPASLIPLAAVRARNCATANDRDAWVLSALHETARPVAMIG
jgi:hypothetical protein